MLNNEFNFKISLRYLILLMAILTITFVVILSLPWLYAVTGSILLCIYAWHLINKHGLLRNHDSIRSIRLQDNTWHIKTAKTDYSAQLVGDSVVTPFISILNFKIATKFKKLSCVIFADSLPQGEYRQLISLLNCNPPKS